MTCKRSLGSILRFSDTQNWWLFLLHRSVKGSSKTKNVSGSVSRILSNGTREMGHWKVFPFVQATVTNGLTRVRTTSHVHRIGSRISTILPTSTAVKPALLVAVLLR